MGICSYSENQRNHKVMRKKDFVTKSFVSQIADFQFEKTVIADEQSLMPFIDSNGSSGRQPTKKPLKTIIEKGILNVQPYARNQTMISGTKETRKRVTQMKYPYTAMGMVKSFFINKQDPQKYTTSCYGSGVLISNFIVLTCAHNIYDEDQSQQPDKILFYPALNGSIGQTYEVARIYFPQKYINLSDKQRKEHDFAFLILKYSTQNKYGYLGISNIKIKQGDSFEIYGYPHILNMKIDSSENTKYLFGSEGNFQQADQATLKYIVNTDNGQSGGALIMKINNQHKVVGIHKGGNSKWNLGLKIRNEHIRFINQIKSKLQKQKQLNKQNVKKSSSSVIVEVIDSSISERNTLIQQINSESQFFKDLSHRVSDKKKDLLIKKYIKQINGFYYGQVLVKGKKQLKHGYGSFQYHENDSYERVKYQGEWKNDQKNGFGVMTYKYGSYQGFWKQNEKYGKGVQKLESQKYEGQFKYNKRNGQGKVFYSNGDIFQGKWLESTKNGQGIYKWANGKTIKGNFAQNILQGDCVIIYSNGKILTGSFKEGVQNGIFTAKFKDKVGICKYKYGKLEQKFVDFQVPKNPSHPMII